MVLDDSFGDIFDLINKDEKEKNKRKMIYPKN